MFNDSVGLYFEFFENAMENMNSFTVENRKCDSVRTRPSSIGFKTFKILVKCGGRSIYYFHAR